MPKLTMEGLAKAMEPPNNCRVKAFMDTLDKTSREVLESALSLEAKDFPSSAVTKFLVSAGFDKVSIPGEGAFQNHRRGAGPCKCRG